MKSWLFALILLCGGIAQAQSIAVILGVRSDNADSDTNYDTGVSGETGYQAGAIGKFDLAEQWQIRSGFIYSSRAYSVTPNGTTVSSDWKFTYFEIPLGLEYKFSDFGGAFIGPAVALNVSKDCGSGVTCSGVNNAPVSFQIGASFKFAPNFGAEVYYEGGASKVANGLNNPKAVIANFMIAFD